MAVRGKTKLQKEYDKAYRELQKRIMKLQDEGYGFDIRDLPKYRKKISRAALRHLKKYSEHFLKNLPKTTYTDKTGRVTTGKRGEEIQRSASARKAARTRAFQKQWGKIRDENGNVRPGRGIARRARIAEGSALIDAILEEAQNQRQEAIWDREYARAERCERFIDIINEQIERDRHGLGLTLSYYNESYLIERVRVAFQYVGKDDDLAAQANNALIELLQIITGQTYDMQALQELFG